jgi:DNA modification methylase
MKNRMNNTFKSEKSYLEFLTEKTKRSVDSGFDANNINELMFPFQEHITKKALKKGRFAIFADCGLGKTLMQLEWANKVRKETQKPVLILAPLAVSGQTIKEGEKFGIRVYKFPIGHVITNPEIFICNYEQLENIDCSQFSGVVLDESSILKNFEGAIRNLIIENFKNTPYKLACTATPSPNDPMELGNHSEFLNVMSRNEMLSMFFVHDGGETAKWRLKGHCRESFWKWVSSWAIMVGKPSDIGFENKGYDLPKLNLVEEQIKTEKRDNGLLFNDVAISATNFNQELRITLIDRLDRVAEIVNGSKDNFIIWIKQNEEGQYLKNLIPDAVEVKGSDSPDYKENKLLGFANNEFRVLITKTKIAQFGLNYQNCRNQIFASLDFSFEGLYQAIRRSYRFGQKEQVNIYLVTTDTMQNVVNSIKLKQKQFEEMQREMTKSMNEEFNLEKVEYKNESYKTDLFEIHKGDCVHGIRQVSDNSVHLSVFSPPFAELYTYSDHIEDMGNSKNYEEFFTQFGFLTKELYRVMIPGRLVVVHCMDLPIQKGKEGFIGLRDFSGMLVNDFTNNGFIYHDRITIWKDPVVEMQRTKALGLLHKQVKKDSSMSRTGIPDYLLVFRKEGNNPEPITNTGIPVDLWQKYASPVWMDINYGKTLQRESARDERDEKHICPLQLETIERAIHLWSNNGDTILSPFAGIGSEGFQAIKMGRKFIGFELKDSYYQVAVNNLKNASISKSQLQLNF